jgi:hypothetical protein
MSVAEIFQSRSFDSFTPSTDTFDDTPSLDVTVSIDMNGNILLNLPLVPVPENYIGMITWTAVGTTFDDPGIRFVGPAPYVVMKQDDQHYFAYVNNDNPNQRGKFFYTVYVGGQSLDPVVQNDPPPDAPLSLPAAR